MRELAIRYKLKKVVRYYYIFFNPKPYKIEEIYIFEKED